MCETNGYYKSLREIEDVVRGFESCTTTPEDFNHRAHLIVAFSYLYLSQLTVAEAAERMRAGLYRFLDHNCIDRQKYNETITLFWLKRVRTILDEAEPGRTAVEILNEVITCCGTPRLVYYYYSEERVSSEEAKGIWVEPDVRPLEFKRKA